MSLLKKTHLQNLKVLYGTGAIQLTEDNEVVRVGGVKHTIRQGVDLRCETTTLQEVKEMVDQAKVRMKHFHYNTTWKLIPNAF